MLLNQAYLKVCLASSDYIDDDWHYIVYEFNMNYTEDMLREGYHEMKQKAEQIPDDDILRELGYTDEDLLKN